MDLGRSLCPSPGVGPYLAMGIGPVDVWVIACLCLCDHPLSVCPLCV